MRLRVLSLAIRALVLAAVMIGFQVRPGGLAPIGNLLDPMRGMYANARQAHLPALQEVQIPGLDQPVTVERDERGVPHIFASSRRDATLALGYVVAQDRLFQMDFLAKLAAGRLSEIYGAASLDADRYLRSIGMDWAARRTAARIEQEAGAELEVITWFGLGANAVIDNLDYASMPFEFKLFDYRPDRYSALHASRLIQYFNFDLSFSSDEAEYGELLARLGRAKYDRLYPRHSTLYRPIIPASASATAIPRQRSVPQAPTAARALLHDLTNTLRAAGLEGRVHGKGSNNWAVTGPRSTSGRSILGGDMHLSMSLPSIWYEAHLVTDSANIYGVLAPGTPVLVQALNDYLSWTITNSGLDAIDHYVLQLNEEATHYLYDRQWEPVIRIPDTFRIKRAEAVTDTLLYTHLGPIIRDSSAAVSIRWVSHEDNTTLSALLELNDARSVEAADSALRHWHSPAQNILMADHLGQIGMRVAGVLPIRAHGDGVGLLDGTTSATDWVGKVDFDAMPQVLQPARNYLTSTNQQPVGPEYPYYIGHDWPAAYRSLRIDSLLTGQSVHSAEDFRRYQTDLKVVQHAMFGPLLAPVEGLSEDAAVVRSTLLSWDGEATPDNRGALALYEFLHVLKALTWDEPAFLDLPVPNEMILLDLLAADESAWLDVQSTADIEGAEDLLRLALEETARTMRALYGMDPAGWRWGDHHQLLIRHLTQTAALSALWRGPLPYPGFDETLMPGDDLAVTHSASWRVIVDFSTDPPTAHGIYPGGQSGNPLSRLYDAHVADYVRFRYHELKRPRRPGELAEVSWVTTLSPR
ncbi:MAG: penicillin acylase family protein [Bacteroidota bacterium]|nr:penicillin acylase family protein [Bacteroidota bacterium]